MGDFWVFGYGSLIWRPGFEFIDKKQATLFGLNRSLCIHSWIHRGTREDPGLVFGLDKGGSCKGVAFLVAAEKREAVIDYLRERELPTNVYFETWAPIRLEDRKNVEALTFVVDRTHEQYAGSLQINERARRVAKCEGISGHNLDYVSNTIEALNNLGIRDKKLETIHAQAKMLIKDG